MAELRTSIIVDLVGNLSRQASAWTQSLNRFSESGQRNLTRLQRVGEAFGHGIDRLGNRYTALITGAAGAAAIRQVATLEARMTRIGINANRSDEEMTKLKDHIFEIAQAPDIRVNPDDIIGAIESIIEKTGDLKFAEDNIRNIGLAIQAAGVNIGEILAEFQKMDIKAPDQVLEALDVLNVQGKEGAFTLQNLAALGPRVVTAYTAMGRTGIPAIREMGAALQVVRQGTGSAEMAATAFEALLRTLTDPPKLKLLQQGGIKLFDAEAAKQGREVLRPINEIMVDIIKATGGRRTLLGQVFDAEAIRAFNAAGAEFVRTGAITSLDRFMNVQAKGTQTMEDSARAAKTAMAAATNLGTTWKTFADQNLAGPIQALADALDSLEPETVQRWMNAAKWIGGIVLTIKGISAMKNLGRQVGDMLSLPGKTKGDGGGGLGALASSAAPMPVWVMNWPGVPGVTAPGAPSTGVPATRGGFLGRLGTLGAGALNVAGSALVGWQIGRLIDESFIQGTGVERALDSALDRVMAPFNKDIRAAQEATHRADALEQQLKARQNSEPSQAPGQPRIEGEIKVTIDSEGRPRVKTIESKTPGLDIEVDTGRIMVAP